MQALTDHGVPSAMKNLVKTAAFKALRVERDENPHALAVYLHAAVGNMFLQSSEGMRQLRAADLHGRAILEASVRNLKDKSHGAFAAYGWTLIRKLHPLGPGPLHLWGEEKNRPAEDSPGVHVIACSGGCQSILDFRSVMWLWGAFVTGMLHRCRCQIAAMFCFRALGPRASLTTHVAEPSQCSVCVLPVASCMHMYSHPVLGVQQGVRTITA